MVLSLVLVVLLLLLGFAVRRTCIFIFIRYNISIIIRTSTNMIGLMQRVVEQVRVINNFKPVEKDTLLISCCGELVTYPILVVDNVQQFMYTQGKVYCGDIFSRVIHQW